MKKNHLLVGGYAKMIHLWPRDIFFYRGPYPDKEVVLLYNFDFTSTPFFRKYIFFFKVGCAFSSKWKEQSWYTNMKKCWSIGSMAGWQSGRDVSFGCHGSNPGSSIFHFSLFLPYEGTPPSTKSQNWPSDLDRDRKLRYRCICPTNYTKLLELSSKSKLLNNIGW